MRIGINCGHTIDGQPGSGAIGFISEGVEEIKNDFRQQRDKHFELAQKVATIDASTQSAHHRIDGLEKDIEQLEAKL